MTLQNLREHVSSLSRLERRELAVACLAHLLVRLSLRVLPLRFVLRGVTWPFQPARRRLALPEIDRLAGWSTKACGGTCLTRSLVARILARRHGLALPVTIGVARSGGVFRAHAWSGAASEELPFVPIWREDSPEI